MSIEFYERWRLRLGPTGLLNRYVLWKCGGVVWQGPFRGMRYVEHAVGSAYYPKILGTYEKELQPLMDVLLLKDWALVSNVGAAEGYYAVGCKIRCQTAQVVAFEAKESAHALIRQLSELNGVSLDIRGHCSTEQLAQVLGVEGAKLLIVDVEGFEVTLLDPSELPSLRDCHILAELHEAHAPGVEALLASRLGPSHRVQIIRQKTRQRTDFPLESWFAAAYPDPHILSMLNEGRRRGTDWLWAEPNATEKLSPV